MAYTCPGCGQTDEEKKNCCGGEIEEESTEKGPSDDKDLEDEFKEENL